MQTARDYLVKANLAKPGRGKFSNEAKEHLKQAIADGHKFSDWDENGRVSATHAEKSKFEKRATVLDSDNNTEESTPRKVMPRPALVRYHEESQVVFTHPKSGQVVVLDTLKGKPVWAVEKIETPKWLEGFTWTLR